jgi:hypothetical protein
MKLLMSGGFYKSTSYKNRVLKWGWFEAPTS